MSEIGSRPPAPHATSAHLPDRKFTLNEPTCSSERRGFRARYSRPLIRPPGNNCLSSDPNEASAAWLMRAKSREARTRRPRGRDSGGSRRGHRTTPTADAVFFSAPADEILGGAFFCGAICFDFLSPALAVYDGTRVGCVPGVRVLTDRHLDITRWDPLVSGNMNVSSAWKIAKVADPFTEVPGFTTAPSGFRLWIEAYRRASANLRIPTTGISRRRPLVRTGGSSPFSNSRPCVSRTSKTFRNLSNETNIRSAKGLNSATLSLDRSGKTRSL